MSNYTDIAFNPRTRQCQVASFIDDAYVSHTYGVRFDGDDTLYRPDQCDLRAAVAAITSLSREVERLRSYVSDAGHATIESEQAWKRRAEAAERRLEEVRAETIEACAKIFEGGGHELWTPDEAASAIRSQSGASDA